MQKPAKNKKKRAYKKSAKWHATHGKSKLLLKEDTTGSFVNNQVQLAEIQIKIEKNVPVPQEGRNSPMTIALERAVHQMLPGESFVYSKKNAAFLGGVVKELHKKNKGKGFMTKLVGVNTRRIWRTK